MQTMTKYILYNVPFTQLLYVIMNTVQLSNNIKICIKGQHLDEYNKLTGVISDSGVFDEGHIPTTLNQTPKGTSVPIEGLHRLPLTPTLCRSSTVGRTTGTDHC